VFVEDVVDAFLIAAAQPDRVNGRHFVIGSGLGISIRDAFELIAARVELITGRRVPVTTTDPGTRLSAIEQRHFVADPSRFSAATGWRPSWSLTEGIDRTIEALRCA
jgi:reductase VcaE